jgi:hypothetical protein
MIHARAFAFSLLFLGFTARAETAKPFGQDPLCDTRENFKKEFGPLRGIHLKHPRLRGVANDQTKWFSAVTTEMESVCEADKKFAAELLSWDRSFLSGQCKPAAEAAHYDQLLLEHSEQSLKMLKTSQEEFLKKGRKGGPDPLPVIFERNRRIVDEYSLNRWDISFDVVCEMKWLYPAELMKKVPPTLTCKDPAPFTNPLEDDKKDPGLFAKLMTRYSQSISYNTERYNLALATATASKARYEACVKEHPGETLQVFKGLGKSATVSVPKGKSPRKGSDITGVKKDEEKRKLAPKN